MFSVDRYRYLSRLVPKAIVVNCVSLVVFDVWYLLCVGVWDLVDFEKLEFGIWPAFIFGIWQLAFDVCLMFGISCNIWCL